MSSTQTPSIGRIVIYKHFGQQKDKDEEVKLSPAVIVKVNKETEQTKETVDLFVMTYHGAILTVRDVLLGEERGQWNWPPRV